MNGNFVVTGDLGGGKTLVTVGQIQDYLLRGRPVATNLDLDLRFLLPRRFKKMGYTRLPDKPTVSDLEKIGKAAVTRNPADNGLLVLDELGTWLNSRTYDKDKDRQDVINWLLHARKLQWDVMLIVQNIDLIDKQVRISLNEHIVYCRRTDRLPVPVIGWLHRLVFGKPIPLPRIHVGAVYYGEGSNSIKIATWVYRGTKYFYAYDTNQVFCDDYDKPVFSVLPPGYFKDKTAKRNKEFFMRLTRILWRRWSRPALVVGSVAVNVLVLVLVVLYLSGGSALAVRGGSQAGPSLNKQSTNVRLENDKQDPENNEQDPGEDPVLVPLSFTVEKVHGSPLVRYFYNGVIYTSKSFPLPVEWINKKPHVRISFEQWEKMQASKTEGAAL